MVIVHLVDIPPQVTSEDLRARFTIYGVVVRAKIFQDEHGQSTGCGIVQMLYPENIQDMLRQLDSFSIGGVRPVLCVSPAPAALDRRCRHKDCHPRLHVFDQHTAKWIVYCGQCERRL